MKAAHTEAQLNGETVLLFPWNSPDRPWNDETHCRVIRQHDLTPAGNRGEVMVVRRSKLKFN